MKFGIDRDLFFRASRGPDDILCQFIVNAYDVFELNISFANRIDRRVTFSDGM